MGLLNTLDISGSALSAQSIRLNTVASNLANAESASSSPQDAYRARQPVFAALMSDLGSPELASVQVTDIIENQAPPRKQFMPDHPLADDGGYVYFSNVNPVQEMADMLSASRAYQNSVEVMNTAKHLLLKTLTLGS